jgi:hypothetical protein
VCRFATFRGPGFNTNESSAEYESAEEDKDVYETLIGKAFRQGARASVAGPGKSPLYCRPFGRRLL